MEEIGPGGHFFGVGHTMERYKTAFHEPLLSDWQNHENWELAGAKTATDRAAEHWQQALKEYEEPKLAPDVLEQLEAYVARRKEELGDREP
ncbi:MAG: methyltransferase, partial [Rhodobacteraceae bacterium]|nr:methyltransferase [Paracoccaceae bacterium]